MIYSSSEEDRKDYSKTDQAMMIRYNYTQECNWKRFYDYVPLKKQSLFLICFKSAEAAQSMEHSKWNRGELYFIVRVGDYK